MAAKIIEKRINVMVEKILFLYRKKLKYKLLVGNWPVAHRKRKTSKIAVQIEVFTAVYDTDV